MLICYSLIALIPQPGKAGMNIFLQQIPLLVIFFIIPLSPVTGLLLKLAGRQTVKKLRLIDYCYGYIFEPDCCLNDSQSLILVFSQTHVYRFFYCKCRSYFQF